MHRIAQSIFASMVLAAGGTAWSQTSVKDPWVRGTVAQQKASGAFMQITSTKGGKLLSVSTPVAGVAEVHEMAMEGTTMRMRAVPALDLPAGQAVELKPGGYHVMLMDLKKPLAVGETVPLELSFVDRAGRQAVARVDVPVRAAAAAGAAGGDPAASAVHRH